MKVSVVVIPESFAHFLRAGRNDVFRMAPLHNHFFGFGRGKILRWCRTCRGVPCFVGFHALWRLKYLFGVLAALAHYFTFMPGEIPAANHAPALVNAFFHYYFGHYFNLFHFALFRNAPHCTAIASAMPWKVLLRIFALSLLFFAASINHLALRLPLL